MIWLLVTLLSPPGTVPDRPPELSRSNGPARLEIWGEIADPAGTPTVTLSGFLTVRLTLLLAPGAEVAPITRLTEKTAWRTEPLHPPRLIQLPLGLLVWRQSFLLEPWNVPAGKSSILFRPLAWQEGDRQRTIPWLPVEVEVRTGVAVVDTREIRPTLPPEGIPDSPARIAWQIWALAGLGLGVLALGGYLIWRCWPAPPPLPPDVQALQELERLRQVERPAGTRPDWLAEQVSLVLRRFLETRFALPVTQQTTPEFLAAAQREPALESVRDGLRELLQQCDLAKYAAVAGNSEEMLARAQELVDKLRLPEKSGETGNSGAKE